MNSALFTDGINHSLAELEIPLDLVPHWLRWLSDPKQNNSQRWEEGYIRRTFCDTGHLWNSLKWIQDELIDDTMITPSATQQLKAEWKTPTLIAEDGGIYIPREGRRQEPAVRGLMQSDRNDSKGWSRRSGKGLLFAWRGWWEASGASLLGPAESGWIHRGGEGNNSPGWTSACAFYLMAIKLWNDGSTQISRTCWRPQQIPKEFWVKSGVNFIKDEASICHFVGLYQIVMLKLYPGSWKTANTVLKAGYF